MTDLWDECGAGRHVKSISGRFFRAVEARHLFACRPWVDSHAEHVLLEAMLETAKPSRPPNTRRLPAAIGSAFRHRPLEGSRFGTRLEPGIWYGSREPRTALAELSHRRLLFFEGSRAALVPKSVEVVLYEVRVRTSRALDLTRMPFAEHRRLLSSPVDYSATQPFGSRARAAGVEALSYYSSRVREDSLNVAVLDPAAVGAEFLRPPENWLFVITRRGVEATLLSLSSRQTFDFPREDFLHAGVFPKPGFESGASGLGRNES